MRSTDFKILVLPFSSRLYKLAFGLLGNREEAEDAVQEVYMKLWKIRDDLDQYDSIEALCIKITRNVCLDQLRRRKIKREAFKLEMDENTTDERDPSDEMQSKERKLLVNKIINQLPEPQRTLIHFRHIEGKEYAEIKEIMNMNENAIRVNISRARKKLKEMLQNQYASWIN